MTKAESRFYREVKTHCRFSERGYFTVTDKRRFPLVYKLIGKQLFNICGYSDSYINVTPNIINIPLGGKENEMEKSKDDQIQ